MINMYTKNINKSYTNFQKRFVIKLVTQKKINNIEKWDKITKKHFKNID